ncbi:hypothetical protein [Rhizobium leguminosarum]|uniref:hypothetical protein n=1 Tax=Rhizobium leguminosarum TaxID=384 RepID=UPI003F9C432D
MNNPRFNLTDKKAINALSREDIEQTTAGLKKFLKKSMWIGKSNHYGIDVVERLRRAPANDVQQRNLAQYIVASVCLHANDGWSYLGRSVGCLLAGDMHRALHLAYYAELRAAMSLLASAGIGIFNQKHYIVRAKDKTVKLNLSKGTHVVAWLALEQWSKRRASGDLFAKLVRPEGRSLEDWFQPHGGARAVAPQAKSWFMQWGMDLGFASKDRDARNESSYRPDGMPATWNVPSETTLEFVKDLWSMLEPSATSSFGQIDKHILRHSLERLHVGRNGGQANQQNQAFVALVNATLHAQNLSEAAEDLLRKFLLRQVASSDPLVLSYSASKPRHIDTDAFAVLSRAVLLLRLATGSAQNLLQRADLDAELLNFWWANVGETRGLWQPGAPPEVLSDLWADVRESLREIDDVASGDPGALSSINNVAFGMSGILNIFSSHERVGLWGLFPG